MKRPILFLIVAAAGTSLAAGGFEVTVGGPGDQRGVFVRETSDGGFVAVGSTQGEGDDVFLVRTSSSGEVLWTRSFGGAGDDWAWSVQEVADGYVVAGSTSSSGAGGFDCLLAKTDRTGQEIWRSTAGREHDDRCWAMVPDGEGGWMVAGESARGAKGTEDCFVVRFDAEGKELWAKSFGGDGSDRCFSVAPSGDGWIVAGQTFSRGAGDRDAWVAGLDRAGTLLWQKTWGGAASDVAHWIAPTRDGNFLVTGYTTSLAAQGDDPYLIKISPAGEEIWSRVLPYDSVVHTITGVERENGGLCLSGFDAGPTGQSAVLIETDGAGVNPRVRRLREIRRQSSGYTTQPTADGGCVMTGHVANGGHGTSDLLLVRFDGPSSPR